MNLKIAASLIFALFISNTAFSDQQKPSMSKSITVKQQLEVVAIDHDARWVKLKDRSGFTKKVNVGNDIRNFAQVEIGDIVYVNYAETIVIKAYGADAISAGEEVEAILARAPEGQKPGKAGAVAKTVVLTITAIDLENSLVTLQDSSGNMKTFRPQSISNLKKVKVGDKVAISFAEALAITVKKGDK